MSAGSAGSAAAGAAGVAESSRKAVGARGGNQGAGTRVAVCAPEPLQLELERVRAHAVEEARRAAQQAVDAAAAPDKRPGKSIYGRKRAELKRLLGRLDRPSGGASIADVAAAARSGGTWTG